MKILAVQRIVIDGELKAAGKVYDVETEEGHRLIRMGLAEAAPTQTGRKKDD